MIVRFLSPLFPLSFLDYPSFFFFFLNDTATTEIYTLSLHDALPIYVDDEAALAGGPVAHAGSQVGGLVLPLEARVAARSEEHTSELQSQSNLVCRLLLEKKKKKRSTVA